MRHTILAATAAFVIGGDASLPDAGAVDDPLVVGLDQLLEVRVGQDAFR